MAIVDFFFLSILLKYLAKQNKEAILPVSGFELLIKHLFTLRKQMGFNESILCCDFFQITNIKMFHYLN